MALNDKKQVREFLSITNYYRGYIRNYAELTEPLSKLTRENEFVWTNECQRALERIILEFMDMAYRGEF